MFESNCFSNNKITVFDICQELSSHLDIVSVQSNPIKVRHLLALLTTKLNNQFKMVTDFTKLDSQMRYQKTIFEIYANRWRQVSFIHRHAKEFIEDSERILKIIFPKHSMAI